MSLTFGIALVMTLATEGSEQPLQHLLIGAALGLLLGFLFSRTRKANRAEG
jgi:hypothetical protein